MPEATFHSLFVDPTTRLGDPNDFLGFVNVSLKEGDPKIWYKIPLERLISEHPHLWCGSFDPIFRNKADLIKAIDTGSCSDDFIINAMNRIRINSASLDAKLLNKSVETVIEEKTFTDSLNDLPTDCFLTNCFPTNCFPYLPWSFIVERCLGWYVTDHLQGNFNINCSNYFKADCREKTQETISDLKNHILILEKLLEKYPG